METGVLVRHDTGPSGTFGQLFIGTDFYIHTVELPWKDNAPDMSCIPPGMYTACFVPRTSSGRWRDVYHVTGVPGRSGILFHEGTFAGDVERGMRTHSKGCILTGRSVGVYQGQKGVFYSQAAKRDLIKRLGGKDFKLIVTNGGGHA